MKTLWNYWKVFLIVLGMVISPADAGIWVDPNSFDVNIIEGCTYENL